MGYWLLPIRITGTPSFNISIETVDIRQIEANGLYFSTNSLMDKLISEIS